MTIARVTAILQPDMSLTSYSSALPSCFHVWQGDMPSPNMCASNYVPFPRVWASPLPLLWGPLKREKNTRWPSFFLSISFSVSHKEKQIFYIFCAYYQWYTLLYSVLSFVFLPGLLRYNWHTALYKSKVYCIMIWLTYIMKWLPQKF